jgi:hypothetical protein
MGNEDISTFGAFSTILDGMTPAEQEAEKQATKNLAKYFLQNYAGTGKTFIIANGEGDQIMHDFGNAPPPTAATAQAMRDWINARQDGVSEARAEFGVAGVQVVYGCEVSSVRNSIQGNGITMANDVVPFTHCDLYSYTPYDYGPSRDEVDLVEALNYLALKAPDSALYGKHNLYLGEYGFTENAEEGGDAEHQKERIRRATEAALGFGCQYVIYWQLYDNEPCTQGSPAPCEYNPALWQDDPVPRNDTRPTNNQMRGFWLVRPDNTRPPSYYYLQDLMSFGYHRVGLRVASGHYISVDDAGGGLVHVAGMWLREWEYLTIIDRNGGNLVTGDPINILTQDGHFIMAQDNGGGAVHATAQHALTWEQFTIHKLNGAGPIGDQDTIAISAGSGHYFVAEGGGGTNVLNANRTAIGPWEMFTVVDANTVTSDGMLAPSATTSSATGIEAMSATLNGTVNPNGGSTTTAFEYGTTTGYGTMVSAESLAGPTSQAITAVIANLACGTLYHVRARATNTAGTTLSSDVTFSTAACPSLPAPTGLEAAAVTTGRVDVSWNAAPGATQYEVMRASAPGGYATLTLTPLTTYSDFSVAGDQAYVYKVRAVAPSSSPFNTPDAAATTFFTDEPLVAIATTVKATHMTEVREAVNALRAAAGLSPVTFIDPVLSSSVTVETIHLNQVRTALNQARVALGLPSGSFTDPTLIAGVTAIKAVHVQELRNLLK